MFERKNVRLETWNYASPGWYYVTICTKDREHLFGSVENGDMMLSAFGHIVRDCWFDIPMHFDDVRIDEFIVMPNHVHGVIEITNVGARFIAPRKSGGVTESANIMGTGALGEIVRWFKGRSTYGIRRIQSQGVINHAPTSIWQRGYYDHIIRDEDDLTRIRQYIRENPAKWDEDEYR